MNALKDAAHSGDQMNSAVTKLRQFEEAKQQQAIDQATIDPRKVFKVGEEITIFGLEDPAHNGLYKVEEITALGVKYRKLRWYEKISRRFRESIGAV